MEQYNSQLIEQKVKEIIFNKQLDEFCGYTNSFPDYLKVINENPSLFEQTLKTFCADAIKKNLDINKNTVGYNFLYDNLFYLSSKNIENTTENNRINFYDFPEVNKIKSSKPGRPKGAKNKIRYDELPKYEVNKDNLLNALKDLIWYKPGLKAKELMTYLSFDESIKKYIFWQLHQNSALLWKKTSTKYKDSVVERFMPIEKRNGYYFNGEIVTLTELAKLTGKSKQILSYRMKKGMNHFQAINEEINANMARKNPGE